MKLKGAEVLCQSLLDHGVDVIFGHPGGAVLPLYDALYDYSDLRHILVRHEQSAAHAAEGYARVTGKVGVCVATSGPGATNLITGLMAAKMDSAPVIAITGQVPRSAMGKEAFQECDTTGIATPVTKRTFLVLRASDLADTIHEAFEVATSGRPGPVLIDVPKDVQQESTEYTPPPSVSLLSNNGSYEGLEESLQQASELINTSQRPVIIAGHGVLISQGWEELRALAEKTNIPVINTLHGVGSFPRSHRLSMGMMGMHGMYWCNMAVDQADLVIGVGMRFDDRVTGRAGSFAPKAKIIHIEVAASQVNKNVSTDVPLIGDARVILQLLLSLVSSQERRTWLAHLRRMQNEHPSLAIPDGVGLMPQHVLSRLNATLATIDDPVVVTGVGQHQMWAAQFLSLDTPNSWITSGGLGVMGFEVPAAIGAQMGKPQATVWSVAGDGGFQMTLQELATISHERLPIKFALLNNGHLGMVRQWQELFYDRRYKAVPVPGPDYVKLAEAYGIPARRVTHAEDVDEALEQAQQTPGPFLIDFVVAPEENVYPLVPPGASLAETIEDPRTAILLPDSKAVHGSHK